MATRRDAIYFFICDVADHALPVDNKRFLGLPRRRARTMLARCIPARRSICAINFAR